MRRLAFLLAMLLALSALCVSVGALEGDNYVWFAGNNNEALPKNEHIGGDTDGDGNNLSLIDILSEDDDMDEHLQADEVSRALRRCIGEVLDAREAEIIRLRYAIGGGEALTQRETAQRCGISRSYVSRIEKKAIEKLRAALQADGY